MHRDHKEKVRFELLFKIKAISASVRLPNGEKFITCMLLLRKPFPASPCKVTLSMVGHRGEFPIGYRNHRGCIYKDRSCLRYLNPKMFITLKSLSTSLMWISIILVTSAILLEPASHVFKKKIPGCTLLATYCTSYSNCFVFKDSLTYNT